jgi:hypothetical protein
MVRGPPIKFLIFLHEKDNCRACIKEKKDFFSVCFITRVGSNHTIVRHDCVIKTIILTSSLVRFENNFFLPYTYF